MAKTRNIAVITARGGSKRLPGKNGMRLGEHPLIAHSILYAKRFPEIVHTVIVSTDDSELAELAINYGAEVIMRPKILAGDHEPVITALQHVLKNVQEEFDNLILLQPTNPLRPANLFPDAFNVFIESGAGLDTLVVDAMRSDAVLDIDGFGRPILNVTGFAPEVILTNLERIEFSDGMLALDIEGNSGQAYRLYQASFARTPDEAGLEFWMQQLDSGALSLLDVAEQFLTSAEFSGTYGENETLGDAQFIDLLYENVLDRSPDAAGYDFWLTQAAQDVSREQMLISFSESDENKQLVAPAIDDGIWFS